MTTTHSTNRLTRLAALCALAAFGVACDDDTPTGPGNQPGDIMLSATTIDFGENDPNLGAGAPQRLDITNAGQGTLTLGGFTASGPFAIESGGDAASLAPGATATVQLSFDPDAAGAAQGTLAFTTNDPDMGNVSVALTGSGAVFAYDQVDREGIPTINTVFNHPPAFSKTDFNVAGPAGDLATYRGQFETVLGATANADPSGTASLLLPDELPVSLGEANTSFATLTGRALADDAVDVALSVVVGIAELQSDNVGTNDVPFLNAFPYLAPAN